MNTTAVKKVKRLPEGEIMPRDGKAERASAKSSVAHKVADIAVARNDGSLGDEYIKLAQAMVMCTLPYSRTNRQRIVKRARYGEDSYLEVTFSAAVSGVPLPYGADRKLLGWLLDRAIRTDQPFVSISSAREYLDEMDLPLGGKSNKELAQRFERLSGLSIGIRRHQHNVAGHITTYTLIAKNNLPSSVAGYTIDAGQGSLPGLEDRHGVRLNADLFNDIRQYNVVLPRLIWRKLSPKMRVSDIALWLVVRCYAAYSTTTIQWEVLRKEFASVERDANGQEKVIDTDTNPRRFRANAREAIKALLAFWPEAPIVEVDGGVRVSRITTPLMPDDLTKNRVRRLRS